MRILQVRFKNLNSLVGEWEIDLTHPAFASDGIFAITGPTGAGKTTILDAMCLALYGRTPRLNKITKTGNEIMSRRTGECFAEVTFETQAGRFRCHWSQHRARKKAEGEFQAPKHEIADADSGEIFESKIRGVADRIEAATGMDFDRFTRSMLLAQGGFAAFLQAAPDERAPILEQITGTEIYSRISIRVHERRTQERKQLDTLQAELAGMPLLAPEEERQLAESLELKVQLDAELTQQVAQKNKAIAWIESLSRLEDALKALDEAKSELQTRVEAFAPEQERLRLAHKALELSADHAALSAIRKEQDADRGALDDCQQVLPKRTDAARQAENAMKTASAQLAARKAAQQTLLPLVRKVRDLDLKIAEKGAPIKAARDAVTELSTAFEALKTRQKSDSIHLADQRKKFEALQGVLTASRMDGALVEHLAGLRNRFDTLKALSIQLTGKHAETTQAEAQLKKAMTAWQEQRDCLGNERDGLEKARKALAEKQSERLNVLEGQEAAVWRKCRSELTTQKDIIGKTLDTVTILEKSQQALMQLDSRQVTLRQEAATLARALATQTETQAGLEKEVGLLETQATLLKQIKDLKEARGQLQDGEPCPLCGAKDHPFAKGNIPAPDETRKRLATVRGALKSVTGDISELKVKLAQVNKDLDQTVFAQKEHAEKIREADRVIGDNCAKLNTDPKPAASDPELSKRLKGLQEENARQLIRADGILEAADAIEKESAMRLGLLEKTKDSVTKRERDTQAAMHKKEVAEQLLARLKKEAAGYRAQQEKALDILQKEIEPYGITAFSVIAIDAAYEQLVARRDQWVSRNKQKTELEQKIIALDMQTRHQAGQLLKMESDIKKQQAQLTALQRGQEALHRERQALFGDKKPDDEEARLSNAIESADKDLDRCRQKLFSANQALSQLKAKIDELAESIRARDLRLKMADAVFQTRLKASGFTDEENYKSACLVESERNRLSRHLQKLSDERTEIASKEREKTLQLAAERQKRVTEEPVDALKTAVVAMTGTLKDLQQEIGGLRQRINDNDRLKQQQQERVQAIIAQKRECSRWDLLHELIGSADGKRFRNFAQGLTFEMMVGHANRQLQKMTDRYLLVRDDAQPLELNVIDNYQAGEIRSTKNLSGGESFVVSLSLALGLSHMASKNVRVDSLFLDEGFGTLDDEALDTALETLASLQQDGKLIGVISHVPAFRERISTQIQVTPQTGGRSRISGPGCRRNGGV